MDALLVVTPEHAKVFHDAGWSKQKLKEELQRLLLIPVAEPMRGYGGIEAGLISKELADSDGMVPKFRPQGINIVRAGSGAVQVCLAETDSIRDGV